jgi:type II secretory pathway pseudopilin PulG
MRVMTMTTMVMVTAMVVVMAMILVMTMMVAPVSRGFRDASAKQKTERKNGNQVTQPEDSQRR